MFDVSITRTRLRASRCGAASDETCPSVPVATLNDGQLDAALNDARADGVAGESGGVVEVELAHDLLAMFFDGLDADAQFRGRFLVGFAFGNQLEHFHLARTQAGVAQLRPSGSIWGLAIQLVKPPGNRRAEKRFSLLDLPNRLAPHVGGGLDR